MLPEAQGGGSTKDFGGTLLSSFVGEMVPSYTFEGKVIMTL